MLLTVLFRPWSYLTITPRLYQKNMTDWIIPFCLSCVSMLALWLLSDMNNAFMTDGIIVKTAAFIQTLPGFYLAALSAIATFNKPELDQYTQGESLHIDVLLGQNKVNVQLTRRRFLCAMFAFLTLQSFIISLLGLVLPMPAVFTYPQLLGIFVCFCFIFLVWQLLTVTLWGLYYLGERMHIRNN